MEVKFNQYFFYSLYFEKPQKNIYLQTIDFLCINCPEKVHITWLGIGRNVILEIKINKKPKYQIKLQKSPLVLDEYDPKNNPSSCVFEGYLDEKKLKTPVTVLGCPSSSEIEVIIMS